MVNDIRRDLNSLINRLTVLLEKGQKFDKKLSFLRLSIFTVGILGTLLTFFTLNDNASIITFLLSVVIFGITAHYHSRLNSKLQRLKKWISIQEENRARQNLDWEEIPFKSADHESPNGIEYDLNLVGKRSLFHLISTTSTKEGAAFLRSLLNVSAPSGKDIEERQALVSELKYLDLFRDKLVLTSRISSSLSSDSNFQNWLNQELDISSLKKLSLFFSLFAMANVSLILLASFGLIPDYWTITLSLYVLIYFAFSRKITGITKHGENIKSIIGRYGSVFDFIEFYRYKK